MHPLIAFLAFLFSPSDDWLLKQSFELYIDPANTPAVVEQYDRIAERFPTVVNAPDGPESADATATFTWAEILAEQGDRDAAIHIWKTLEHDKRTPPEFLQAVWIRLGEVEIGAGRL